MSKPHRTALMPIGTVIEHDGEKYRKIRESRHEPFPWTDEFGGEFDGQYGDERMAHLLDDGGRIIKEPTDHACPNCDGVDPASCPFNAQEASRG